MRSHSFLLAIGVAMALMLALIAPLGATESFDDSHLDLPGANESYPLRARDVTVEDALRMFSRNLRIGLVIDEGFDGSATTDLTVDGTRQEYLEELAALFDFGWYFDGAVLHVFNIGEMQIEVYPLQQTNGAELISMLKSLGVYQKRFFHRADGRRQALLVSGPASYIETVGQVVQALETAETRKVTVLRGSTGSVSATILSQPSSSPAVPAAGDSGGS
jgi:type III secretion protein C